MNKEESAVYMALSNDPNERGRLWKNHPMRRGAHMLREMQEYYSTEFIKAVEKLSSK